MPQPQYSSGKLRNMSSLYLLRDGQILLLYRQGCSIVHDLWIGSAGGHFQAEEFNDAKKCVLRELKEELGLTVEDISEPKLRYVTIRNACGELRQNYYFFADLNAGVPCTLPSSEGITKWISIDGFERLPMPFTARYVLEHYVSVGRFDSFLYVGIANDDGVQFIRL